MYLYATMFETLKLDDGFPYNGNQKVLHYSEERKIEDLKYDIENSNKSDSDKKQMWKEGLDLIEEIKNQNPHPAKVFAPYPGCFWDTDVYWLHWELDKTFIISRLTSAYKIPMTEDSFDENIQMKYAEKNVKFLNQYYSTDEIISVLRKTKEATNPDVYQYLSDKYNLKNFKSHNWWEI